MVQPGDNGTMAEAGWVRDHVLQGENWPDFLTSWDLIALSTGLGSRLLFLIFLSQALLSLIY